MLYEFYLDLRKPKALPDLTPDLPRGHASHSALQAVIPDAARSVLVGFSVPLLLARLCGAKE